MTQSATSTRVSVTDSDRTTPGVHVVIVTYGERAVHLAQVLRALRCLTDGDRIVRIIVVDNAASISTRHLLEQMQRHEPRLDVLPMGTNTGSAGGFAAGIDHAIALGAILLWLLDDDNAPEPDALETLLAVWASSKDPAATALCSLRPVRPAHRRLARGLTPGQIYPRSSHFMGFHIADVAGKLTGRLRAGQAQRLGPVPVPFAPYGGLLLPRTLAVRIGLPDRRFFTYADDTDYTLRIDQSGGRLLAVPDSRIRDVDASWDAAEGASILQQRLLRGEHAERAYLSMRNHVFVSRHRTRKSSLEYSLNRLIFLLLLMAIGLATRRVARLRLLLRAVHSGERGTFEPHGDVGSKP